jgi:hypothetical protein
MVRLMIGNAAHLNGVGCCIIRLRIRLLRLRIRLLRLRIRLLRLRIRLLRLRIRLLRLRIRLLRLRIRLLRLRIRLMRLSIRLRNDAVLSGQRVCRLIVVVRGLLRLLPRRREFPLFKRR